MRSSVNYLLHSGKNSKFLYYLNAYAHELLPDGLLQKRLQQELECCAGLYDAAYIADRVDYYCHATEKIASDATPLSDFHKKGHSSVYYLDSHEIVRWFNPDFRWKYLFGDIRDIPDSPTVVKSRNICEDNGNAVLLNLDKCRHFVFLNDRKDFCEKKDIAIFRGQVGTRENRIKFMEMFGNHPKIDAANTVAKGGLFSGNPDGKATSPRLSLYEHLDYKYIMALEGNDVASNLKWVMSSNSLAVMPRPTCETWFMEGRLKPNVHYVEIRDDYADLIEKMDYYTAHPDEAKAIARNANQYVDQFRDKRRERYIALLVMQRYFSLSNK